MPVFTREVGAILNQNHQVLHLVDGSAGLTVFPQEELWRIHTLSPGCIFALSHVHPPSMTELSHEDKTTLMAQSLATYPFPARMITIAEVNRPSNGVWYFMETCYFFKLESKEEWLAHKEEKRRWEIVREWEMGHELVEFGQEFTVESGRLGNFDWYGHVLLRRSYQ